MELDETIKKAHQMELDETIKKAHQMEYEHSKKTNWRDKIAAFPWWLAGIVLLLVIAFIAIATSQNYKDAFQFIITGINVTITTTLISFLIALIIGLLTGLGRISSNLVLKNISTFYVEIIRGIPMLVLIFFIALVLVPAFVTIINQLGVGITELGFEKVGAIFTGLKIKQISMTFRAIAALSITYGAFLAEIFRAGIQSVGYGQMEAARSQGMSHTQAMWYIILPQAIRNILPALGNDFISMLKDSSLVSILAIRDITQVARLYGNSSFDFPAAYTTLATIYLAMTLMLSMLVKLLERRYQQNGPNK